MKDDCEDYQKLDIIFHLYRVVRFILFFLILFFTLFFLSYFSSTVSPSFSPFTLKDKHFEMGISSGANKIIKFVILKIYIFSNPFRNLPPRWRVFLIDSIIQQQKNGLSLLLVLSILQLAVSYTHLFICSKDNS